MSYNLIDNLREQGWDFLIPQNLNKTVSDEYVTYDTDEDALFRDTSSKRNDVYEPDIWELGDSYFNDMGIDDEEDEIENDEYSRPSFSYGMHANSTLYDLKYALDCDTLSDDEFLSLSVGDLLGVTNSQLKFISSKAMRVAGISRYKDMIALKKGSGLSVEQMFKYINVILQVSFNEIQLPIEYRNPGNNAKLDSYITNIALKHKEEEAIQLINWYRDYTTMLESANIINDEHRENGEPYFNYKLFPKVSHIKDLHDKASRDYSTFMSRQAAARKEVTNKYISSFISTGAYQQFLYSDDNYSVIEVKDVDAILDEADNLKHCLASYIENFAKGESYLYFIRKNDALDKSLYTAEVLEPDEDHKKWYLNQCYGYKDTTQKSDSLSNFILKWCREKMLDINCPI